MKTSDLIPLILYELGEGDKYGFELTKSIENLSNGKIVIKQATLYTILKKLEKSKFISSYWQDSEIGGKRHYYKLTQNGSLQLATMPKIEQYLDKILADADAEPANFQSTLPSELENSKQIEFDNLTDFNFLKQTEVEKQIEMFEPDVKTEPTFNSNIGQNTTAAALTINQDNLIKEPINENGAEKLNQKEENTASNPPQLKESVLPTKEIFENNFIDNLTETEINSSNASLLHKNEENKTANFAENSNVVKFTENQTYAPLNLTINPNPPTKNDIVNEQIQPKPVEKDEIKFVDYVNFKQSPKYILANKIAKNMWYRILCSSVYLIIALAVCAIISTKTSSTIIGNIFLIIGIIVLIFTPIFYAYKLANFKLKCQENKFKFDIKKRLIVAICFLLLIGLIVVILNIVIGNSSLSKMFGLKNFSNFYSPFIISSAILIDFLFSCLFLKKSKN